MSDEKKNAVIKSLTKKKTLVKESPERADGADKTNEKKKEKAKPNPI